MSILIVVAGDSAVIQRQRSVVEDGAIASGEVLPRTVQFTAVNVAPGAL